MQKSVEQTRTNLLFTYLYLYTEHSSREIPGHFHISPNSCKKSWKIIKTMGALGVIYFSLRAKLKGYLVTAVYDHIKNTFSIST